MNPVVSIIVPMYNVEKYLHQCIDSLINQTLRDIEIILVDDGSPDKCGEIADDYAKLDSRIQVVHQQNQGLGPARNTGLRVARGEYVGFVDSDDYVKPKMFEHLYQVAQEGNFDIVTGGHDECMTAGEVRHCVHPLAGKSYQDQNAILKIRKRFYGHWQRKDGKIYLPVSAWRSIYKRKVIADNNLFFREILSEDIFFDLDIYKAINSIAYINTTDYCYRKEGQPSITRTFSEKKLIRYRDVIVLLKEMAQAESNPECIVRAQCHAADRCREYARLINRSGDSLKNRKRYLKNFATDQDIRNCWKSLSLKNLSLKQGCFHWLILHKFYVIALMLAALK